MAITVFTSAFGPMDERTQPAPFPLNAGTYKIWVQAVDTPPSQKEKVRLEWDESSYGTSGARGNQWSLILDLTPGSGIQSFTIPGSTNMTVRLVARGNVLVTITS